MTPLDYTPVAYFNIKWTDDALDSKCHTIPPTPGAPFSPFVPGSPWGPSGPWKRRSTCHPKHVIHTAPVLQFTAAFPGNVEYYTLSVLSHLRHNTSKTNIVYVCLLTIIIKKKTLVTSYLVSLLKMYETESQTPKVVQCCHLAMEDKMTWAAAVTQLLFIIMTGVWTILLYTFYLQGLQTRLHPEVPWVHWRLALRVVPAD